MQVLETVVPQTGSPEAITAAIPASEPWVDIVAVAKHIGFGKSTTLKMVKQGKLPGRPVRNGAKTFWRFQLSAVDQAMKSGSIE